MFGNADVQRRGGGMVTADDLTPTGYFCAVSYKKFDFVNFLLG